MNLLSFSSKIEHGSIRVPQRFQAYENAQVKIIVLIQEEIATSTEYTTNLRNAFLKLAAANPFGDVLHPTQWQKKLRDEWE